MNIKLIKNIENSACNKCSNLLQVRDKIVVGKGNPNADTIIIGQNAGAQENKVGMPFIGPAGKLLHKIIESAGYDPLKDFFFSNVIMCHTPSNVKPTKEELDNCSPNLTAILSNFKKIITVGHSATEGVYHSLYKHNLIEISLTAMGKLLTRGKPKVIGSNNDILLFITYHPSYLLRNGRTTLEHSEFKLIRDEIIAAKKSDIIKQSTSKKALTNGGLF